MTSLNLLTFNLQGYKDDALGSFLRMLLATYEIDVCCLQECTTLGGWRDFETFAEYGKNLQEWLGPQGGNRRCSFAMLWNPETITVVRGPNLVDATDPRCRGIQWAEFTKKRTHFYLVNYHGFGEDRVQENIEICYQKFYGQRWIMAGDFNREGRLTENKLGGEATIHRSRKVTRPSSGKELDYAISSIDGVEPGEEGNIACENRGESDHKPVVIRLSLTSLG